VAFYFFDFGNQAKRTALGCLFSIALQLCEQSGVMHKSMRPLYEGCSGGSCDLDEVRVAIGGVLRELPQSFIVIDALDECLREGKEREQTISCIEYFRGTSTRTRLFMSSRVEIDIKAALDDVGVLAVGMPDAEVDKDIRVYVRSRLSEDRGLKMWNQRIQDDIEQTVTSKSKGMYVSALPKSSSSLAIDEVL